MKRFFACILSLSMTSLFVAGCAEEGPGVAAPAPGTTPEAPKSNVSGQVEKGLTPKKIGE